MHRVFNFSAGPAMLPIEVLQQLQSELIDWQNLGMSVMEVSHRSSWFKEIAEQSEQDLRDLLNIPSHYQVLFLQGGGRGQFAAVPINILGDCQTVDYVDSGIWSKIAIAEAEHYAKVNIVCSSDAFKHCAIPDGASWQVSDQSAYCHIVENETVNGLEFPETPGLPVDIPLVADQSSNILSRPTDIEKYGIIYASAQKNIGPAGMAVVIVRDDLLNRAMKSAPTILNYTLQAKQKSMLNTPPTLTWYITHLVFKWVKKQGGVAEMARRNQQKAEKLYHFIDESDYYHNPVEKKYRSRMNVIFNLADPAKDSEFVTAAADEGLASLKGHRLVGGLRASLYNAMPEAGVDALIEFMRHFEKKA